MTALTAVTVSWNAVVTPNFSIDHYTVLYNRAESQRRRRQDGAMSVQFPTTATSGVIAGLDSTATYQFQVFATVTVDGTQVEGERISSPTSFVIDGKECICFVYYYTVLTCKHQLTGQTHVDEGKGGAGTWGASNMFI